MASLTDETPEGRSIVVLAKQKYDLRVREFPQNAESVPFSAETRLSGVNVDGVPIAKVLQMRSCTLFKNMGGTIPQELESYVTRSRNPEELPWW